MNKRGQLHISFGMIFSVIMIIIFISFAFFAISKFLGIQRNIQINQFYDDLQNDINAVWNSPQSNQEKAYTVPSSIEKICFVNSDNNMIVYNEKGRPTGSSHIDNIDTPAIVSSGNSCFENLDGKINLVLRKEFDDTLVTIEK